MDNKLVTLKSEFNNIISIKNTVESVFDVLQVRINKLKAFYSDLIKNNKTQMFVFGLDSFNFQSKLIDIEYDDMKRLFLAINNRMYCEYFKLNRIIRDYILKSVEDKKIIDIVKVDNYPIYKDLEPYKNYDFEITHDIHQNIVNLIGILMSVLNTKETELSAHRAKQNIGLNINNYITTFTFNNTIMREQIMMFIAYIEFFHSLHTKYLKRFSNKIQLMHTHIDTDIKFDETTEVNKETKKELLEELNNGKIDKELLHDLRKSISVNPAHVAEETSESESSEEEVSTDSPIAHLEQFSHFKDVAFDSLFKPVNADMNINVRQEFAQQPLAKQAIAKPHVVSFSDVSDQITESVNIKLTTTIESSRDNLTNEALPRTDDIVYFEPERVASDTIPNSIVEDVLDISISTRTQDNLNAGHNTDEEKILVGADEERSLTGEEGSLTGDEEISGHEANFTAPQGDESIPKKKKERKKKSTR